NLTADFYDSGAGISAAVVPYLRATLDSCDITGYAGADLQVTISVSALLPDADDIVWTWNAVEKQLFTVPWHPCGYWTGTITYHYQYGTSDGNDDGSYTHTYTLVDSGHPPPGDGLIYTPATTSSGNVYY